MCDEFDDLGADPDLPTAADLLAMIREGTYDVPRLAAQLGLSEGHVRLLLAGIAATGAEGENA